MQPWEEIEHTADWALHVRGSDLRALFENAARGMCALMGGHPAAGEDMVSQSFSLAAPDWETLFVDWLSELVYLVEDQELVLHTIDVAAVENYALTAHVSGTPGREFFKHIKAVTYHDLAIRCSPEGCETVVVFDV